MADLEAKENQAYVDYETFLSNDFSPHDFANSIVITTNNPSDHPLDLNTPLSRVLFDVQEVDTHLDALSHRHSVALLNYTRNHVGAANTIHRELEAQLSSLSSSYDRLEQDVLDRHDTADKVRLAAERVHKTVRLCRYVTRSCNMGRQLEPLLLEIRPSAAGGQGRREDARALARAAITIANIREVWTEAAKNEEGEALGRVAVMQSLRSEVEEAERTVFQRAEQIVSSFSISSLAPTAHANTVSIIQPAPFSQAEESRIRTTSALLALHTLSISHFVHSNRHKPDRLAVVMQEYLRRAISASTSSLTSSLTSIAKFERATMEVAARCQNIAALEMLLASCKASQQNVQLDRIGGGGGYSDENDVAERNLLDPVLEFLDTNSFPSFFWRSMASQMSPKIQKLLKDGGPSARTLRANKDKVADMMRNTILVASRLPPSMLGRGTASSKHNWDREATIMVSSVVGTIK